MLDIIFEIIDILLALMILIGCVGGFTFVLLIDIITFKKPKKEYDAIKKDFKNFIDN